jgi:hypothetical protein
MNIETDISAQNLETKLIEGAFERLPRLGADPVLWPIVEQRLGRGVGRRVVRVMLHGPLTGKRVFMPPTWWQIEGTPELVRQTFHDDGEAGPLHHEPMKLRPDGGFALHPGCITRATVRIEGQPLDIEAAEAYALGYAEAVQVAGGTLPRQYDSALRPIGHARLSR